MIYNSLRIVIYFILAIISIFSKKKRIFLKNRLFQKINLSNKKYIWIHAASVGEVNLSDSLIKKFLDETENDIILTVLTDSGIETAKNKYNENKRINILYFPIDDYFIIKKIFKTFDIKKVILIETEIWPNLIKLGSKYSKTFIVNGRISDKSYKKYLKLKFYLTILLKKVDRFIMQTKIDKERIMSLGAPETNIYVTGNLKYEINLEKYKKKELEDIKNAFNINGRKILVAGSTHPGEEEFILNSMKNKEDYFIFLVPRHIERSKEIDGLLKSRNIKYVKWHYIKKEQKNEDKKIDVVLVNEIGVLRKLYQLSDVSFVGGTMVNVGGHSLLEPLYYNKTPIFGENLQNVREISNEILKRSLGFEIKNEEEFIKAINKIELDYKVEEKIENFFNDNKNTLSRTFKLIIDIK